MNEIAHRVNRILETELFTISGTEINVATLVMLIVVIIATFIFSNVLRGAMLRAFRRRGIEDKGSVGVATRLAHYTVVALGLTIAVHTLGINLSALFAAGAVFAVAIGFAMQNISQNFISGVILLVERAIKPGDILQVEGMTVRVVDMRIRTTVARTLDDEEIIIPNSILVQSIVKNQTLQDPLFRLRVVAGVTYDSDMKRVREVLEQVARGIAWRVQEKEPVILMKEFGNSSVDWEVSVWVNDPWTMQSMRSKLLEAVWFALKDAGIVIAFPQLDLHLDDPVQKAIVEMGREK